MIMREDFVDAIKLSYDNPEDFISDLKANVAAHFEVFVSIDGNPEDADVLMLDTLQTLFVTWYKMEHFGRCIQSNIKDSAEMLEFVKRFKEQSMKEAEEYMSQFKAYALATGRRMSLTHM